MKGSLESLKQFFKSLSSYRPDRRTYIFLVCIVFSTCIWFLIALSKDYTTFVDFPVQYSNVPQDQIITNELPDHLALEVSSHGFGLLSYLWFSDKVITVDLSRLYVSKRGITNKSFVVTRNLVDDFAEQFEPSVKLHHDRVFPDTIHVFSSDTVTRKVGVKLDATITFADQHNLASEVQFWPRAVYIYGPRSIVDTMSFVKTKPIILKDLSETQSMELSLELNDNDALLKVDQPKVLLTVPVDLYTEQELMVPIRMSDLPIGYSVKLHPDVVQVKYLVGMKSYNQVSASMFKAFVELPDTSELTNNIRLRVQLTETPDFIKMIDYKPKRVEPFIRRVE